MSEDADPDIGLVTVDGFLYIESASGGLWRFAPSMILHVGVRSEEQRTGYGILGCWKYALEVVTVHQTHTVAKYETTKEANEARCIIEQFIDWRTDCNCGRIKI
jgi:hypothetical protein